VPPALRPEVPRVDGEIHPPCGRIAYRNPTGFRFFGGVHLPDPRVGEYPHGVRGERYRELWSCASSGCYTYYTFGIVFPEATSHQRKHAQLKCDELHPVVCNCIEDPRILDMLENDPEYDPFFFPKIGP
jgi:hypothetical protein